MIQIPELKIGYRSKEHTATVVVQNRDVAMAFIRGGILIVVLIILVYLSVNRII